MSLQNFSAEDVLLYELVHEVRLSPDGREILFELQSSDQKEDATRSAIWLLSDAGGTPRQLTLNGNSTTPRWSPDGKHIAFLSDRDSEEKQLYILPRNGGEALLLTSFDHGVSDFNWASDSQSLLAIAAVSRGLPPDGNTQAPQWVNRSYVIETQYYKSNGVGYLSQCNNHLFRITLEKQAIQLTSGDFSVMSPLESPDGTQVLYLKYREGSREAHKSDFWIAQADGSSAKQMTSEFPSPSSPSWSPDGKYIFFTASESRDPGDGLHEPFLLEIQKGESRKISDQFYETASTSLFAPAQPIWDKNSKWVTFLEAYRGCILISKIDIHTGHREQIVTGERHIDHFHGNGEKLAFLNITFADPGTIYMCDDQGQNEKKLYAPNESWWSNRSLPKVERREFRTRNGPVDGWLLRPQNNSTALPLVVDVHGGPHLYVSFGYPYHPSWYALLNRGWAVLALNTSGSSSYGKEFAESLRGRWGELDLPEYEGVIDDLKKEGAINNTVMIIGKSYGGYFSAWAAGNSKKFTAAIVGAPVGNLESHARTSDSGFFVGPYDMKAEYFENPEIYRKLSPVNHIHKSEIPILFMQGEDDLRCPVTQAEELYGTLMRATKVTAQMVLFPGGDHGFPESGRPSHRVEYHRHVVDWFTRWSPEQQSNKQDSNS